MRCVVYARCAPVTLQDAGLVNELGAPLEHRIPAFPYASSNAHAAAVAPVHSERRQRMQAEHCQTQPVFPFELFPIIPHLEIPRPLPVEHVFCGENRRQAWKQHLLPDHYESYDVDEFIVDTSYGLGLFQSIANPIDTVVYMCSLMKTPSLLHYYLFHVCLQFYFRKRFAFMRVRTDRNAQYFSDALPPWIAVCMRDVDFAMPVDSSVYSTPIEDHAELVEVATTQPFVVLLLRVVRWVIASVDSAKGILFFDAVLEFCKRKVTRGGGVQVMANCRFREVLPTNHCARISEAILRHRRREAVPMAAFVQDADAASASAAAVGPDVRLRDIRFFPHPKAGASMQTLKTDTCASYKVPTFYTHMTFNPLVPIVVFYLSLGDDVLAAQRSLIFHLFSCLPVHDRQDEMDRAETWWRHWQSSGTPLFPQDAVACCAQYKDNLLASRARYAFYARGDHLYAYIPALLAPEGGLVPDETDVTYMTGEAWTWCCNRGRVRPLHTLSSSNPLVAHLLQVLRAQLQAQEAVNTYWLMWVVQQVSGCEEDGVATAVAYGASHASVMQDYARVQSARARTFNDMCSADARVKTDLAAVLQQWDRCKPVRPTSAHEVYASLKLDIVSNPAHAVQFYYLWTYLFPVSRVEVRLAPGDERRPWIDLFQRGTAFPKTQARLREIVRDFLKNSDEIMEELDSARIVSLSQQELRQMHLVAQLFLPRQHSLHQAMERVVGAASTAPDLAEKKAACLRRIEHRLAFDRHLLNDANSVRQSTLPWILDELSQHVQDPQEGVELARAIIAKQLGGVRWSIETLTAGV